MHPQRQLRVDHLALGKDLQTQPRQVVAEVVAGSITTTKTNVVARAKVLRAKFVKKTVDKLFGLLTRQPTATQIGIVVGKEQLVKNALRTDVLALNLLHLIEEKRPLQRLVKTLRGPFCKALQCRNYPLRPQALGLRRQS